MNTDVVIYTRPGCPYCYRLRRGLRRRRVPFGEINIRHDSVATAIVCTHANGTETVPTARIGGRWLVNPTAAAVSAAVGHPARPVRILWVSTGRRMGGALGTPSAAPGRCSAQGAHRAGRQPMTAASADTLLPPQNPGPAGGDGAAWLPAFRDWITPPRRRLLWPFGIRYAVLLQDRTRRRASRREWAERGQRIG